MADSTLTEINMAHNSRDSDDREGDYGRQGSNYYRGRHYDQPMRNDRFGTNGTGNYRTEPGRPVGEENFTPVPNEVKHDTNEGYSRQGYGGKGSQRDSGFEKRVSERDPGSLFGGQGYTNQGANTGSMRGEHNGYSSQAMTHRGKGPKGYRRSDERIQEELNERLTDDHEIDASDIEVSVAEGIVTLSGSVSSRAEKRAAEDLAESVSGVRDVINTIRLSQASADGNTDTPDLKDERLRSLARATRNSA